MSFAVIFPGQGTQQPGMGVPWRDHAAWARRRAGRGRARRAARAPRCSTRPPRRSPAPAKRSSRCSSPRSWPGKRVARPRRRRRSRSPATRSARSPRSSPPGVLTLDDGVRFAARRAELTQAAADAHPGRMAALLGATVEQAEDACAAAPDACWVANDNAPGQVVIAGTPDGVDAGVGAGQGARRAAGDAAQRRRRVPHAADARRRRRARSRCSPTSPSHAPTAPVVSNHDAAAYTDGDGWRERLAASRHRSRCAGARRWTTLAGLGADHVPRGRPRLDARRRSPSAPSPTSRVAASRPPTTVPDDLMEVVARWRPHSTTARGSLVPERMIVAPSVGVFRPLGDVDAGDLVDAGQTDRRASKAPARLDARLQPVPRPARRHARPPRRAPPRGPARRLAAGRAEACGPAIAGWGTARPRRAAHQRRPRARVDTTDEWIVERTGIRERRIARPDETTASPRDRGRRAPRSSTPGSRPTRSTSSIVATATPEQPIPHTGAFVGDGLGLRCGSFDLDAGCAGLRLRARRRRVDAHRRRARPRARRRRRDALAHHRPARPRHVHPLRRRRRPAWCSAASPDDGPGPPRLGPRLRRLRRPACSRSPPAAAACPRRAETVAGRRALHEDGRPRGVPARGARRRRLRADHARPGRRRAPTTSTGSSPTRPTSASSRPRPAGSGIPTETTIVNIDRYGNTSAASIPLALAEAADDGRLQPGDLVLVSGFGAGHDVGRARCSAGVAVSVDAPARVAFVTGGSRGIGRATARRARATPGTGSRSATRTTTTGAKETAAPRSRPPAATALAVQADVADPAAVDAAFSEIEDAFGPGRAPREQRRHHPRRPHRRA